MSNGVAERTSVSPRCQTSNGRAARGPPSSRDRPPFCIQYSVPRTKKSRSRSRTLKQPRAYARGRSLLGKLEPDAARRGRRVDRLALLVPADESPALPEEVRVGDAAGAVIAELDRAEAAAVTV